MDRQCAAAMLPYINDFDHLLLFCCHSWAALQYYVRRCGLFLSVCHVREPCNRLTDRDAIWVMDLGGFEGACIRWGGYWRHVANTNEPYVFGGNAAFLSN